MFYLQTRLNICTRYSCKYHTCHSTIYTPTDLIPNRPKCTASSEILPCMSDAYRASASASATVSYLRTPTNQYIAVRSPSVCKLYPGRTKESTRKTRRVEEERRRQSKVPALRRCLFLQLVGATQIRSPYVPSSGSISNQQIHQSIDIRF